MIGVLSPRANFGAIFYGDLARIFDGYGMYLGEMGSSLLENEMRKYGDVVHIKNTTEQSFIQTLKLECAKTKCLFIFLTVLDPTIDTEEKLCLAESLECLLSNPHIKRHIECAMYAQPIPNEHIDNLQKKHEFEPFPILQQFTLYLIKSQPKISQIHSKWVSYVINQIPIEYHFLVNGLYALKGIGRAYCEEPVDPNAFDLIRADLLNQLSHITHINFILENFYKAANIYSSISEIPEQARIRSNLKYLNHSPTQKNQENIKTRSLEELQPLNALIDAGRHSKPQTTRLGDILVSKGLLSVKQLENATEVLARKRHMSNEVSLGEVLIELGYIKKGEFSKQRELLSSLRKSSIALSLSIPLLIGHGNAVASQLKPNTIVISAENHTDARYYACFYDTDSEGKKTPKHFKAGVWNTYENNLFCIPAASRYKITYRVASLRTVGKFTLHNSVDLTVLDTVDVPKTGDIVNWVSVERYIFLPEGVYNLGIKALLGEFSVEQCMLELVGHVPTPRLVSPPHENFYSCRTSAPFASLVKDNVTGAFEICWATPNKRENGDDLDITELGGYEVRYKKSGESAYTYMSLNDPLINSCLIHSLQGDYIFQISAYDKNGIYSSFIDVVAKAM